MADEPKGAGDKSDDDTKRRLDALEEQAAARDAKRPNAPSRSSVVGSVVSATSGKRLVVVGTVGTGVLALIAAYRNPGKTEAERTNRAPFRIVVGTFAAGTILAALAEVAPKIAGGFAMLMLATAAFVVGGDTWAGISAVTKGAPVTGLGPGVGAISPTR